MAHGHGLLKIFSAREVIPVAPRKPQYTAADRLISALMAGILGFATMLVIWLIVLYLGGQAGEDVEIPFFWNWIVAGIAGVTGFLVGPERMLDGFGVVWRVIGAISWGKPEDHIPPASRKRKRQ